MTGPDNKIIELSAAGWLDVGDMYANILPALGAPEWHGHNMNALIESIVCGDINSVEPPFLLRIREVKDSPKSVLEALDLLKNGVDTTRADMENRYGDHIAVAVELIE